MLLYPQINTDRGVEIVTKSDGVAEFWWDVPSSGYAWTPLETPVEGLRSKHDRYLLAAHGLERGFTRYRPLDDRPALFHTFAALPLPLTEGAVIEFADAHGWLGLHSSLFNSRGSSGAMIHGERIEDWAYEIEQIRLCIGAWEAIRRQELDLLSRYAAHLQSEANAVEHFLEATGLAQMIPDGMGFAPFAFEPNALRPAEQDLAESILIATIQRINSRLREHVSVSLLHDASSTSGAAMRVTPKNLLGAVWLQLAQAVDGNKTYRACDACGDWFELAPDSMYSTRAKGVGRSNRRYCSDRCKSLAYRRRRAEQSGAAAAGGA